MFDLTADEEAEILAILEAPDDAEPHVAAAAEKSDGPRKKGGRKGRGRKRCKRTPLHPHCRSVKWARVYEALRRKGKSKKNAAQIANHMYNKWRAGLVKRKAYP